ncbi:pilus assembly PilX N-terminal domain-containing protein [Mesoterricola sediminis]|nr:pilus assembly PilX N-terminal domain-containing protein [Mesoterricola sediminis]
MSPRPQIPSRPSEQGGLVILIAFIILATMTIAALAVSQTSLRDLAITGNEGTGRKAAEAADSGIDWVITWSNPDAGKTINATTDALGNNTSTLSQASLTGGRLYVQQQMQKILLALGSDDPTILVPGDDPQPNTPGAGDYGLLSKQTGSTRFFLRSVDYTATTAPELFQTGYVKGSSTFLQPSVVQQAFDTEVRYLGRPLSALGSGGKAKVTGGMFLLRSTGRANIVGTTQAFVAQREALVEYAPGQ